MESKNSNLAVEHLSVKCSLYNRIGHKAVAIKEEVMILGGTGPLGEIIKPVLRFNLENSKVETLPNVSSPNLDGFSAFAYDDKIYVWGGTLGAKPCNQLYSFQGSSFEPCPQKGRVPIPRAFHSSAILSGKYFLIYGGIGETEFLHDWHLLDLKTLTWEPLEANIELPINMLFKLVWSNGRGFMLSEFEVARNNEKVCPRLKNLLFEIRITSFSKHKLRIDQIDFHEGEMPPARSNFNLIFVEKEMWMLGGDIFTSTESTLCNDVWGFDIEALTWSRKPILLKIKLGFDIVTYNNRLFLIGGLQSLSEMSNIVEIITIKQKVNYLETKVCNFCKAIFTLENNKLLENSKTGFQIEIKDPTEVPTQISTNFLSKMARTLQNPIQAIGLLIDNCLNMGASSIFINIFLPNLSTNYFRDSNAFLYIGDNSSSFSSEEILRILFSFRFKVEKFYRDHIDKEDVKMRNEYGLNLKLASLRLGTSCLFVTTTTSDEDIFVAYFSDSETDCPDGDPSFHCFNYILKKDGSCSSILNKQIIKENVKHFVEESKFLNNSLHKTKVYVFGINDIAKTETKNNKFDISFCYSQGTLLSSLAEYVSSLYLNPFFGREIFIDENKLLFRNLLRKFKEDEKNGSIQEIDTLMEENIFVKVSLYRVLDPSYHTNFVYIYHQNRLIYTIPSKERLICGFLEIPDLIEVDFFKSKIEKWQEEKKLIGYIESKEEHRKRQRRDENFTHEHEHGRKIKPNYLHF